MIGKNNRIGKIVQAVAMTTLFVLIIVMINYVNDIQGTARVINYAGLVRGATQRMVKLEIAGIQNDDRIKQLDSYLQGIGNGSSELDLIYIDDPAYQDKIKELNEAWIALKDEIPKVRQRGYEHTAVIAVSERYFAIADDLVSIAEAYSENCAQKIYRLEVFVIFLIVMLTAQLLLYAWKAASMSKANVLLKKEVYIDKQTGLPNKSKCMELIADEKILLEPTCVFMFDLNNLKYVNDNMGHDAGDFLITSFSQFISENIPRRHFIGRYGGDEFIAIVHGSDAMYPERLLHSIQDNVTVYNASKPYIPISYAVGYASNQRAANSTLRMLLCEADRYMYINKKATKESAFAVEKQIENSLVHLIKALGNEYTECSYYNLQTGRYQRLNTNNNGKIAQTGDFQAECNKLLHKYLPEDTCIYISQKLSNEYMRKNLSLQKTSYDVVFSIRKAGKDILWRITVMYVNQDEHGELTHVLVAAQELQGEKKLKFEANHDSMTGLFNKATAFSLITERAAQIPEHFQAMLVCDIDDFKHINDSYGHIVGDDAIMAVASSLQESFYNEDDVVARFGGDEFMVYMNNLDSIEELEANAGKLLEKIKTKSVQIADGKLTVSVGIVIAARKATLEELFQKADEALYEAKKQGKNQFALKAM